MSDSIRSRGAGASLSFRSDAHFELQPGQRRLLVDGQPVALGGRAFDLLVLLAGRPDQLVSKAEALDLVWPGLIVEEGNLQVQISNLRKVLGNDVIATIPGRGYRFTASVDRAGAPLAPAAPAAVPALAPSGLRLIGRGTDLRRLAAALREPAPCVTLLGPPGVGKTTLAHATRNAWDGPTHWVDLTSLEEGDGPALAEAIARACGAGSAPALAALLARAPSAGRRLVVLDNAEHVAPACAAWIASLGRLAHTRLLVTSQLALGLDGECVERLGPLPLDGPAWSSGDVADEGAEERADRRASPDGVRGIDLGDGALALLVEHAVATDRRYVATAAALPTLMAICGQLDGLPLALEMAAARIPMLGAKAVHDGLAERFAMLSRGHRDSQNRHRRLSSALEWSYHLLDAQEQRLFRVLGLFVGGFTADLAVALAADDPAGERWAVIDRLASLVDRSLVVLDPGGDVPRYRLLETMRAYALTLWNEAAEQEQALRRRLASTLLDLLQRREQDVGASRGLGAAAAEMANVREAVLWARRHALPMAVDLSAEAARLATFTDWRSEVCTWLVEMRPQLDTPAGLALPIETRAAWWRELARALVMQESPLAEEVARRSFAVQQELGAPRKELASALVWLRSIRRRGAELERVRADVMVRVAALEPLPNDKARLEVQGALSAADTIRGDWAAVLEGRRQELEIVRRVGAPAEIDAVESNIVLALNRLGRYPEAIALGADVLARVRASGADSVGNLPWAYAGMLEALIRLDRLDEARLLVPAACTCADEAGVWVVKPLLCLLAGAQRRHAALARLVGHAEARLPAGSMTPDDWRAALLDRCRDDALRNLGAATFGSMRQQGAALDDRAAAELAASSRP